MDALIAAAARALSAGDPLAALQRVALRDDPPALALRGIAMAQLGELVRARELLRRAARAVGARETVARSRCVVAEAEVALALREPGGPPRALLAACAALRVRGDTANAGQGHLIAARRALLLGQLGEVREQLSQARALDLPPLASAVMELVAAELALRSLHTRAAREALIRAHAAAQVAAVPALLAEVRALAAELDRPAARCVDARGEQALRLDGVEALLASRALVVDACRHGLSAGAAWRPLAGRPVLFALAQTLAEAWPADVPREALIARAFRQRVTDETHRARLRVEIGRLRALIAPVAGIAATPRGFVLRPEGDRPVALLLPPLAGEGAALQALLADGAAWSSAALAQALGASQRTVQRALAALEAQGRVRAVGRSRARRWLAPPLSGFTTILLLPAALSPD